MPGERARTDFVVVGRAARVWEVPTLPTAVQRLLNPRTTRHAELSILVDPSDARMLLSGAEVIMMADSEGTDAPGDASDGDDAIDVERWRALALAKKRDDDAANVAPAVGAPLAERGADEVEREMRLGFAPPSRGSRCAAISAAAATAARAAAGVHPPPSVDDATLASRTTRTARTARTIAFVARRVAASGSAERERRLELALRRRGALDERLAFLRPDSASNGAWRRALAVARKAAR